MQIREDDGALRHLVIDDEGSVSPLSAGDVPVAAFNDPEPSIGIGVRRESATGPHLGRGVGGKWELTGDLEEDRDAVVRTLEQLLAQAKRGQLDHLLAARTTSSDDGAP